MNFLDWSDLRPLLSMKSTTRSQIADRNIEQILSKVLKDALLLRFDMRSHSQEGRSRFCELNAFERKGFGLPEDSAEIPLPYFAAFVPSIGRIDVAWRQEDITRLIATTLREKEVAERIRQNCH